MHQDRCSADTLFRRTCSPSKPSAVCAAGEWSGIAVTYDATGEAQELPYQYVPQAFREWGAVPRDWHTQCSTLADGAGLLTKLKRLYPIVGEQRRAVAILRAVTCS